MTDKVQHTPGPWHCKGDETPWTLGDSQTAVDNGEEFGHTEILFSLCDVDDEPIGHLVWEPLAGTNRVNELRANARLIAAAPELLEALKSLQKAVHDAHLLDVKKQFNLCVADAAANTAITKAEAR